MAQTHAGQQKEHFHDLIGFEELIQDDRAACIVR